MQFWFEHFALNQEKSFRISRSHTMRERGREGARERKRERTRGLSQSVSNLFSTWFVSCNGPCAPKEKWHRQGHIKNYNNVQTCKSIWRFQRSKDGRIAQLT